MPDSYSMDDSASVSNSPKRNHGCVLVETTRQLSYLQTASTLDLDDYDLIAMSPEADYALSKAGLRYRIIEDYYSEQELIDLGMENYQRANEFCDDIDRRFSKHVSDQEYKEVFSSQYFYYTLKVLLDTLLHRAFTLRSALKCLEPHTVVCFAPESYPVDDSLFFFHESVVDHVAPSVARSIGMKINQLSLANAVQDNRLKKSLKLRVADLIGSLPGGKALIRQVQASQEVGKFWFRRKHDPDVPTMIALQRGYDLRFLIRYWQKQKMGNLVIWDGPQPDLSPRNDDATKKRERWRQELDAILVETKEDSNFRQFFNFGGVDTYIAAESRLEHFFRNVVFDFLVYSAEFNGVLRQNPSATVVAAPTAGVPQAAALATSLRQGVPTVIFQHGGSYGQMDVPMTEHNHFFLGSHFFCYGEGIPNYCAETSELAHRPGGKRRSEFVVTGSPVLDSLAEKQKINDETRSKSKLGIPPGKRTVLYVTTNLSGDMRYFNHHSYPDIWYWRLQQSVMQECLSFDDVHVIVKLHPSPVPHNPMIDWLNENQSRNFTLVTDGSFVDLLGASNLVILDYVSTTLLQALTTDKQVIGLAESEYLKMYPGILPSLQTRTIFSDNKTRFLADIHQTLSEPDWSIPIPVDDTYLKLHGTHLGDGLSAQRAATAVSRLATGTFINPSAAQSPIDMSPTR